MSIDPLRRVSSPYRRLVYTVHFFYLLITNPRFGVQCSNNSCDYIIGFFFFIEMISKHSRKSFLDVTKGFSLYDYIYCGWGKKKKKRKKRITTRRDFREVIGIKGATRVINRIMDGGKMIRRIFFNRF